jgi:hypothetical protein
MHQTTVRFGPDLWSALETECARLGLSAAQYLREAALARLAYTAGRRGEQEYELALVDAGAAAIAPELPPDTGPEPERTVRATRATSEEQVLAAAAVSAQSKLAWARAREVREQAAELRRRRREMGS